MVATFIFLTEELLKSWFLLYLSNFVTLLGAVAAKQLKLFKAES
jgi:hypothetical protein